VHLAARSEQRSEVIDDGAELLAGVDGKGRLGSPAIRDGRLVKFGG
jgi:hypothetical protein